MKVTKWFGERDQVPSIIGVYEVDPFENRSGGRWSFWDGKGFSFFTSDIKDVMKRSEEIIHPFLKWRGLAEDPNKESK